jgi:F-type H+-transporting ATPase subunit c
MDAMDGVYLAKAAKYVAAGLCMALGGFGPALAQGYIGCKACVGIGKNPESAKTLGMTPFLCMAFVETSTIFSLLVAVFLLFVAN